MLNMCGNPPTNPSALGMPLFLLCGLLFSFGFDLSPNPQSWDSNKKKSSIFFFLLIYLAKPHIYTYSFIFIKMIHSKSQICTHYLGNIKMPDINSRPNSKWVGFGQNCLLSYDTKRFLVTGADPRILLWGTTM